MYFKKGTGQIEKTFSKMESLNQNPITHTQIHTYT